MQTDELIDEIKIDPCCNCKNNPSGNCYECKEFINFLNKALFE